jgi:two-component system chemotaxis response regulator CheB
MAPDSKIRVMIVDDSAVFRGLMSRFLESLPSIEIIGVAFNGKIALDLSQRYTPDIILLDVEMPGMDGITAIPELLKLSPSSRIIMVSSLTMQHAEVTLRALELGASDYITKPVAGNGDENTRKFYDELAGKIMAIASGSSHFRKNGGSSAKPAGSIKYPSHPVKAIAIGASTGGPQAMRLLCEQLSAQFPPVPVFITQHMPAAFTVLLAKHIEKYSGRPCVEGKEGDIIRPDTIYLAPGNFHLCPKKRGDQFVIHLSQEESANFCRPSLNFMLQSLAALYEKHLLAAVLTGMGSDGLAGARQVVEAGGTVIAQDVHTSVVWGMPQAVAENNLCSAILPLEEIAPYIIRACNERKRI